MDIPARAVFKVLAVALLACTLHAQQAAKPAPPPAASEPDPGDITNSVYHNTTFGFTYKIPFGWVDRTREMREDAEEESTADSDSPKKSILLLAVFERPPGASGETVNSAVVVAAEATASYPGLRSAEQYFGPLTELTAAKGFTVVNEPYEFPVGETQLVRGDFSKQLKNLTMLQSTLVVIEKGYIVSFTFIGAADDEVDQLVAGLSFTGKEVRKETPPRK
jgi:hypothetical protein